MSEYNEGGEGDSLPAANDHNAYSDNISFNSSSISVYSAEEQIIQQRGRRSPRKISFNDHYQSLQHHQPQQSQNNNDLFLSLKQTSMQSPDAKTIYYHSQNSTNSLEDIDNGNASSRLSSTSSSNEYSCRKGRRNLNKSLLRTPVKRRLKLRRESSGCIKKLRRRC